VSGEWPVDFQDFAYQVDTFELTTIETGQGDKQ
jgi:hypothetical protein